MGKRQDNLLAKIAAQVGKSIDEIKEVAAPLQSDEESAYEAQSIINFFYARVRPTQRVKETDVQFEARYKEWQFKKCKQCDLEFAYAYSFDGVAYCSFDCIEASLKEVGIIYSRHSDSKRRWSQARPAIVSGNALEVLRDAYQNSSGVYDVPWESIHPKYHQEELFHSDSSESA